MAAGFSAGLEITLTKMQQVAARLHFAGAAEIVGLHGEAIERAGAGHQGVACQDRAKLDRKRVE